MSGGAKVEANGVCFHFEKVGCGDHHVLLLPGILGNTKTDFAPQLEKLNREKFTIVGLDPRGNGESRPPDRDYPLNFYYRDADDAAAVMEALNINKYSVLGWSDGGNSALILAAKYKDKVNKVVVWGSNSYVTSADMQVLKGLRDISLIRDEMEQQIEYNGMEYYEKTWNTCLDTFEKIAEKHTDADGNVDLFRNELPKIEAETLILHGGKDVFIGLFHAEYIKANVKNSRLEIFDKGGHNLHLRFSDWFNVFVEEFLQAL